MKSFSKAFFIICICSAAGLSQITARPARTPAPKPSDVQASSSAPKPSIVQGAPPAPFSIHEAKKKLAENSALHFKEGLLALRADQRKLSIRAFDKAIEVFLLSTLNIYEDLDLQRCYGLLVENISRIEIPDSYRPPQLRTLVTVCGWQWTETDMKAADEVAAKLIQKQAVSTPLAASPTSAPSSSSDRELVGFKDQGFEPSPLDDMARIALSPNNKKAGTDNTSKASTSGAGPKPQQARDGKVKVVLDYFNEVLDDPYSAKFVSWTLIDKTFLGAQAVWFVVVKYRAKNAFGAYVLRREKYYIAQNRVIKYEALYPTDTERNTKVVPNASPLPPSNVYGSNLRVVFAQAGDTVAKLAARYGADPATVAKYNGLLPNSVLGAGREIKLPGR